MLFRHNNMEYDLKALRGSYLNGGLAILLVDCAWGYLVKIASINLWKDGEEVSKTKAFLDVKGLPYIEKYVLENELGTFSGEYRVFHSVKYPLYEFNLCLLGVYIDWVRG